MLSQQEISDRLEIQDLCYHYAELIDRGFDLFGTDGDDTIAGTNADDRVYGFDGPDTITTTAGNDLLDGGAGALGSGSLASAIDVDTFEFDVTKAERLEGADLAFSMMQTLALILQRDNMLILMAAQPNTRFISMTMVLL